MHHGVQAARRKSLISEYPILSGALIGDQHLSDTTPESRKDNYTEAIFAKMEFILDYCNSNDIWLLIFLETCSIGRTQTLTATG